MQLVEANNISAPELVSNDRPWVYGEMGEDVFSNFLSFTPLWHIVRMRVNFGAKNKTYVNVVGDFVRSCSRRLRRPPNAGRSYPDG